MRLNAGATVTVAARDVRGRPTRVDHDAVPVTLSWAADDQPEQVHIGGGLDLTACYAYHPDRRLRIIRWVQGLGAGGRCPDPPDAPPGDLCAGAVAVYATGDFDAEGKARQVRQCVAGSARTDTLAYDDRGRLTAWRTAGSGPLGLPVAETAHFRRYDALDQLTGEDVARWPVGRRDFPTADGVLPAGVPLDRLNRREVVRTRSDGAIDRIADHETGDEIMLTPDAAGRATTDSQDFRALALDRDRQGRPLRDTYDGDGRRLSSAAAGETLRWDAHGLVEYAVGARARVFAPPLPGVQLSRRSDGEWEAALVTPTQTPLAVLGVSAGGAGAGAARLQALYSPSGEASEVRIVADGYGYPKTWAGYLKYPDLGQFGETANLYDAGARLYAPRWGQFLEGDPVLPEPDAPDTWGRYAYGGGDTVGMWDPAGRFAWVPVLAALAWWGASTAVDIGLDAAAAHAMGEEFSLGRSIFVNGAINAATAGLAGKAKHLEKLSDARRLFARGGIDAAITTSAEATYAGAMGQGYDLGAGLAGNLLGGVLGGAAGDLAAAGVGRFGRSEFAGARAKPLGHGDQWNYTGGSVMPSLAAFGEVRWNGGDSTPIVVFGAQRRDPNVLKGKGRGRLEFQDLEVRGVRDLKHVGVPTLSAMRNLGFAAKDHKGRALQLHHHQQNPRGFIVEIPASKHSIRNRRQHPLGTKPGMGLSSEERGRFDRWRVNYWKERAASELRKRGFE